MLAFSKIIFSLTRFGNIVTYEVVMRSEIHFKLNGAKSMEFVHNGRCIITNNIEVGIEKCHYYLE